MMKQKRIFAGALAVVMLAAMPVWAQDASVEPEMQTQSVTLYATPTLPQEDGAYIIADDAAYEAFCEDVANGVTYEGMTVKLTGDITTSQMVGSTTRDGAAVSGAMFKGTFDGGENTITFTYETDESASDQPGVGIFSGLSGATVKNLNAVVTINLTQSEYAVGGIAGYMTDGAVVENCHVSGSITSVKDAGGIVGKGVVSAKVMGCTNAASVTTTNGKTGGIASAMYYTPQEPGALLIEDCTNTGEILCVSGGYSAGIVGLSTAAWIKNCKNEGKVTINDSSGGGIVGDSQYGSVIEKCENTGVVENVSQSGSSYGIGGIVGWIRYTTNASYPNIPAERCQVTGCVNRGEVKSAGGKTGGVVGTVYDAIVMDGCENHGKVTAGSMSGGVIGNYQEQPATLEGILAIPGRVQVENSNNYATVMNLTGGVVGAFIGHMPNYTEGKFDFENNGTVVVTNEADREMLPTGGYYDKVVPEGIAQIVTENDSLADIIASAAEGSVISLAPGVYDEAITLDKPITLKGTEGVEVSFIQVQANNVTLDGLTFVPSQTVAGQYYSVTIGSTGPVASTTIRNCNFTAPASAVSGKEPKAISISTYEHTGIVIENNTFSDQYETAVYCRGGENITLKDNTVGTKGFGFRFLGTNGAVVTGNYFDISSGSLNGTYIWDHAALEFRTDSGNVNANFTVTDNIFAGSSNIDFYRSQAAFGEEKLDLSQNYWGGGEPSPSQIPYTEAEYIVVNSYYKTLDETTGKPDDLVVIPAEDAVVNGEVIFKQNGNQVELYLEGRDEAGQPAVMENFVALEMTLDIQGELGVGAIEAGEDLVVVPQGENTYLIRKQEDVGSVSGDSIKLGAITLEGFGTATVGLDESAPAQLQREINDSIVKGGEITGEAIPVSVEMEKVTLTLKLAFNNNVAAGNSAAYNDFTITISGATGDVEIFKLGSAPEDAEDGVTYIETYTADNATVAMCSVTTSVIKGYRYTVEVKGAGYRTYRTSLLADNNKIVNVWNNVKDTAATVVDDTQATKTFLAGDIVMDNVINLYDLSAVVSYFGQEGLDVSEASEYARYDLNRDGKIDSKDVAMVLVSWEE